MPFVGWGGGTRIKCRTERTAFYKRREQTGAGSEGPIHRKVEDGRSSHRVATV